MDAAIISSVISVIESLVAGLCVAIPLLIQTRHNSKLTTYRIEKLEEQLEKLNEKFDKHEEHTIQIAKLNTRVDSIEFHLEHIIKEEIK